MYIRQLHSIYIYFLFPLLLVPEDGMGKGTFPSSLSCIDAMTYLHEMMHGSLYMINSPSYTQ